MTIKKLISKETKDKCKSDEQALGVLLQMIGCVSNNTASNLDMRPFSAYKVTKGKNAVIAAMYGQYATVLNELYDFLNEDEEDRELKATELAVISMVLIIVKSKSPLRKEPGNYAKSITSSVANRLMSMSNMYHVTCTRIDDCTILMHRHGNEIVITRQQHYVLSFNPEVVVNTCPLITYVGKNYSGLFDKIISCICLNDACDSLFINDPSRHMKNVYSLGDEEKQTVEALARYVYATYDEFKKRMENTDSNVSSSQQLDTKSYYQSACETYIIAVEDARRESTKIEAIKGFVRAMYEYLASIIEDTQQSKSSNKEFDISYINESLAESGKNFEGVLHRVNARLNSDITDADRDTLCFAVEVYKTVCNDTNKLTINDTWLDACNYAAIIAKNLGDHIKDRKSKYATINLVMKVSFLLHAFDTDKLVTDIVKVLPKNAAELNDDELMTAVKIAVT